MGHVHANAEEAVRRLVARLSDGRFRLEMDNGAVIAVAVGVDRAARHVTIDFGRHQRPAAGHSNAPFSVVRAATMYVLRTMIDDPIPMNEGCLAPVTIRVPEGSMLNPRYPAAVVAGNVETSQAVTDALFGAFGALAASQGTMNNFTFGNALPSIGYQPTGRARGQGFDGASAVQTHDQQPPDRSRSAGNPLSGAAGRVRDPARFGRHWPVARRRRGSAAAAFP